MSERLLYKPLRDIDAIASPAATFGRQCLPGVTRIRVVEESVVAACDRAVSDVGLQLATVPDMASSVPPALSWASSAQPGRIAGR